MCVCVCVCAGERERMHACIHARGHLCGVGVLRGGGGGGGGAIQCFVATIIAFRFITFFSQYRKFSSSSSESLKKQTNTNKQTKRRTWRADMRRDGVWMLDAHARFAKCETGSTTCIVSAVGENVLLAGRAEIQPGFRLSRFRGNVTMFFAISRQL